MMATYIQVQSRLLGNHTVLALSRLFGHMHVRSFRAAVREACHRYSVERTGSANSNKLARLLDVAGVVALVQKLEKCD